MLLTLLPTAFAADAVNGLSAFTDKKHYTDSTFIDVSSASWYAGSVGTVYAKGIMDGVGGGRFDPESTISWSQAVTIAARLHAAYQGKDIPAAEGVWYTQYLDYAQKNGLLPAICPEGGAVDTTPITREGLAVLFRSVLDEKDLPAVNDQTIPDLNDVREEYRDTVSEMFSSGIFTGTDGGRFDPNGSATRAQAATIIARLLCPGQRVSHDSRQNPYMSDQMGNLYNGGIAARIGNTVYYIYLDSAETAENDRYSILARTDGGQVNQVYATEGDDITYLSVGPDGLLYFIQHAAGTAMEKWTDTLRQLNPETGDVKTVYAPSVGIKIDLYLFYDGELYTVESRNVSDYWIGRVTNGRAQVLAGGMDGWEGLFLDTSLYAFGGKLYYVRSAKMSSSGKKMGNDQFCALDLETGTVSTLFEDTAIGELAYQNGTVWHMAYTNNAPPRVLERFSLAMPESVETLAVLTGDIAKGYSTLFANGPQLYYQVSRAQKIWSISSSGETAAVFTTSSDGYENCAVTSQGAVIYYDKTGLFAMPVEVLLPDGTRVSYSEFLSQP